MPVCDAHGAVWASERQMSPGEGYLLGARFMQKSAIQDRLINRDELMMQMLGITSEQYRLRVESIQGTSPWLICDQCMRVLKLSQEDKDAAREAAKRFSLNNGTPGHIPRSTSVKQRKKKPAYFVIFGNGFRPSEEQAKFVMLGWLEKRKAVLGTDAIVGVNCERRFRPQAPRMQFVEVVTEFQNEHPAQVVDDILMFDQQTGKDMALVAVWLEDTSYIQTLLKPEKKHKPQPAMFEQLQPRKRWWEFWK